MVSRLFVDKIDENEFGGWTNNPLRVKKNLSVVGLTIEEIISQAPQKAIVPTAMFHIGKYAVIFQCDREMSNPRMAFIDYRIDLDQNFDHFADFLTPQLVAGFHKTKEIIKRKPTNELEIFILSDDPLFFGKESEN